MTDNKEDNIMNKEYNIVIQQRLHDGCRHKEIDLYISNISPALGDHIRSTIDNYNSTGKKWFYHSDWVKIQNAIERTLQWLFMFGLLALFACFIYLGAYVTMSDITSSRLDQIVPHIPKTSVREDKS